MLKKLFVTLVIFMALLFGCTDDRTIDKQIVMEADRLSAETEKELLKGDK